jgi:hypothetical protein
MTDLQLHRRLSGLADDLAPEPDPFAQVAAARSRHRRQRRNRAWTAGSAVAVAVLAVGVPMAVTPMASPDGRNVAAPTMSAPATSAPAAPSPVQISRLNEDFIRVVDTLAARTAPLDLTAPAESATCPDATSRLSDVVDAELVAQGDGTPGMGCGWTSTALRAERLSLGFTFMVRADGTVHQMILDETAKDVTGQDDAAGRPGACFTSDLSDTPRRTTVQACSVAGRRTQWNVLSGDAGNTGLWQISLSVPAGVDVDQASTVLTLIDVTDAAW